MKTDRCYIQSLRDQDQSDVLNLLQNASCRAFLGGVADAVTLPERFRAMLTDPSTIHWGVWLIESHQFIGLLSLGSHHDGKDQEISYQFLPEFWGHGFAAESIRALLGQVRERFGMESVIAETQTANTRSIQLLERLGFVFVRTLTRFDAEQAVYRLVFPPS